jgi:hypothetical protein
MEIIKTLHQLTYNGYEEDVGGFHFSDSKNKGMIVISDKKGETGSLNSGNTSAILEFVESNDLDELYVIATDQTKTSYKGLKNNHKISVITSKSRIQLTEYEILDAFKENALLVCKERCNVSSMNKLECKAEKERKETCEVRYLIENAEFHARMKWKDQLLNVFSLLAQIELKDKEEIQES